MTIKQAFLYLNNILIKSTDKTEKRALSKILTLAMNMMDSSTYAQVSEGLPIRYFTNKNIKCKMENGKCIVYADDRIIFEASSIDDINSKHEVIITDDSIDKRFSNKIIKSCTCGDTIFIYDDYNDDISIEIDNKLKEMRIEK
jgi:hypothetical protein